MPRDTEDSFLHAAEGDRLDQERSLDDENHDPEIVTRPQEPDGVAANPADVDEQNLEVRDDDEDDRSEV